MKRIIVSRVVLFLVATAVALTLLGGASFARSHGSTKGNTVVEPSRTHGEVPPTNGLAAPPPVEGGKLKPQEEAAREAASGQGSSAMAASTPQWFDGTSSNTHFYNIITESYMMLTTQWVGYWGTEDLSYPKTGELYYGRAVIGNVGTISTAVVPNVQLPPNTHFSINPNDPNMRVLCYLWDFQTNTTQELTGANCDQTPSQGLYGAHFAPESGTWSLPPGKAVIVIFPIFSTDELKGIAATPADCLIGATFAAGSFEVWDAPEVGDTCPLPSGHGAWQGVFVPFNPPTVAYPSPSTTNITTTTARTKASLFSHFDPGTAFVELGTTTSYGQISSVSVPGTQDSFAVTTDWTDLKPGTTYHWRLRFVDTKGRTFTGADQVFKTADAPADTTSPKVNRVAPAENATGVGTGTNVSAYFSEAMRAGSINANTVKLFRNGTTTPIAAAVAYDSAAKRAILNPDANLKRGAKYKAVVTTGARDQAGNPLDQNRTLSGNQPKRWSFTVKN